MEGEESRGKDLHRQARKMVYKVNQQCKELQVKQIIFNTNRTVSLLSPWKHHHCKKQLTKLDT
jgi:hypothetical protein